MQSSNPGSEKSVLSLPGWKLLRLELTVTSVFVLICLPSYTDLLLWLLSGPFFEAITARARPDKPVAQEAGTGAKV